MSVTWRCSNRDCRRTLTAETVDYCPHNLPFCEGCTWEDGCPECDQLNGAQPMSDTPDTTGLRERAERFLVQCGPCDAGLPMGCACNDADPRPVIAALLDALALTPAPNPTPERDAWDVEALAKALGDIRLAGARQQDWWESDEAHPLLVRALSAECVPWAEGLLSSDWLAAHDAEVQRVTAERIAQAIEAARDKLHPAFSTEDHGNLPRGYTNAARIAREEASRG